MATKSNNAVIQEIVEEVTTVKKPAARETIAVDEVKELETVTVKGGFRGYWVDCPAHEVDGVKYPARKQFKFSRRVKLADGTVIKQTAWVTEQDATAWNFMPGVKYTMEFEAGEEMIGDKGNGNGQYLDEYSLYDATIVSANGHTTPPVSE